MRKVLAAACALFAFTVAARADIIIARANAPVATGDGYYAYTYNVQLTAGQLDPVSNGTPVQFGTVYDFGPLVTTAGVTNNISSPGSVFISKSGYLGDNFGYFTFSFNRTDTPASTSTSTTTVADNPTLANIRLTYVGMTGMNVAGQPSTLGSGAITVNDGAADLGTFTVYSPFGATNPALTYDGQTYKGSNNTLQANQGQLSGPLVVPAVVPSATPEPSSFALLGTGLLGMVGVVRRRFARSN